MFKLEERRTGRMSLRPDLTTQIAKLSATLLKDQLRPLRSAMSPISFGTTIHKPAISRSCIKPGSNLLALTRQKRMPR